MIVDPLEARRRFFARAVPAEYAAEWAATLAEVPTVEVAEQEPVVVFRLCGRTLALSARLLKAVMEPVPICVVPHRRDGVLLGLVAYGGEVLPCCSVARLLGFEDAGSTGKMMVLEERAGVRWVVPVEAVIGVPSLLREASDGSLPGWSEACVRDGDEAISLLTPDTLFARMLQAAG